MFPWNFPTSACHYISEVSKAFSRGIEPRRVCSIAWIPFFSGFLLAFLPHGAGAGGGRDSHPRSLSFLITRTTLSRLPPRPSKISALSVVHRGAWIVADFLWAHSVGHSQGENSLGESLFIFAVARDTWGKIVQLYLVHSSRPSAFPSLHPLPLYLTFTVSLLHLSFRIRVEIRYFSHSRPFLCCFSVVHVLFPRVSWLMVLIYI